MEQRIESVIDELWRLWHLTDEQNEMDGIVSAISRLEDVLRMIEKRNEND